MENFEKFPENSSDGVDVVDGITPSCFRRQESEKSDGISEYHGRFNEEVIDTKNSKYSEYYSMDYPKKGYLIILAHSKFKVGGCNERNAELDVTLLEDAFSKLDFEINVYKEKTLNEIMQIVYEVSMMDFKNYATLVVAVSSHGKSNDRIAAKDAIYDADEVLFDPIKINKTLYGKPKIFLLGACRGHRVDRGITLVGPVQTDSANLEEYKIPLEADILKVYATIQGYMAYHNPCKCGSHFFKYLTEALIEHTHRDLIFILTIANLKISTNFFSTSSVDAWDNNKQCLCFQSTLTRLVSFRYTEISSMSGSTRSD